MQEQALQSRLLSQALVHRRIAVLVVARHGVADMLGMHADLVGAAGFDPHFAIGMTTAPLEVPIPAELAATAAVEAWVY